MANSEKTGKAVRADRDRISRTFKKGQCQLCLSKVPVKDQYRVVSDLDKGVAKKLKGAKDGQSHYCADCANERVTARQYWLDHRNGKSSGRKSGAQKKSGTKRSSTRAKAKSSKASGRKTVKKPSKAKATKAAAKSGKPANDPFA